MNAYANPGHEQAAALVRAELPGAYLSVSAEVLPAIRFQDRISTTALDASVGPKLQRYLERPVERLAETGFGGVLLGMQSNGGVMTPAVARRCDALTLLSGPAGARVQGCTARALGCDRAITTDMGGTSFEASASTCSPSSSRPRRTAVSATR
jgi:N-methylhydantoinase A